MEESVHVYLLGQETRSRRPVPARKISTDTYVLCGLELHSSKAAGEVWEFVPGDVVKTESVKMMENGKLTECLVAIKRVV